MRKGLHSSMLRKRYIIWIGLCAIVAPLLVNLYTQYRSLTELQRISPLVREESWERRLNEVASDIQQYYRMRAYHALDVPTSAILPNSRDDDVETSFADAPAEGVTAIPKDRFRWSVWARGMAGETLVRFVRDEVFDFYREVANGSAVNFMDGARLGIEMGTSNLVPDVTVLRPHSSGSIWVDPADVALVVEIESEETRRYDRLLKPAVYAAAGIPAYWRVEAGPVLRVHALVGESYQPLEDADGQVELDSPYPIRVNPAQWR